MSEQSTVRRFTTGSTHQTMYYPEAKALHICIPDRPSQDAVAEVLGALDDKIAANARLTASCESLAVALAGSVAESVALGDVVSVNRRVVDPGSLKEPLVDHFSLPAFDASKTVERVLPAKIKSGKFLIGQPAVLLSKLNPRFPRAWDLATLPDVPALASTEFVVLQPLGFPTTVLWALLSQAQFGEALEGMVAGTSGSHQRVRPADMLATVIGDPRTMSDVMIERITLLGRRADLARSESLTLSALRDTLLPALMSGKLRVRDSERAVEDVV